MKRIRENRGVSQAQLARELGISYQTYNGYETKGNEPKYDLLIKIAKALYVSIDELLGIKRDDEDWYEIRSALFDLGFEIKIDAEKINLRIETTTDENAEKNILTFLVGTFNKAEISDLTGIFDERLQRYRQPMLGDFLADNLIPKMNEIIEEYPAEDQIDTDKTLNK